MKLNKFSLWGYNYALKRAVKMPLLLFLDTGLAAYLLKWGKPEALKGGAMSGALFESYVFSEIYKSYLNAGKEPPIYYYRDKVQKEIDLLIYQNGIMEVLPMDENELSKTELWTKRGQDFHTSGLSRKDWCQKHQIALSTLGYWIRKLTEAANMPDQSLTPVFARLPSGQELSSDFLADLP